MADGLAGRPQPRPDCLRRRARHPRLAAARAPEAGARRADAGRGGGAIVRPRRRSAADPGGLPDRARRRGLRRGVRRDRLRRPGRADLRAAADRGASRARPPARGGDRWRPAPCRRPRRARRAARPHAPDRRRHRFARRALLPVAGRPHALEAAVMLDARALALAGRLFATDLRVEAPALVAVVGPNGSGKTSLLHALAGIGGAGGEARIDGADPASLAPEARRRLLAYLPAGREIAWPLAARDLVALGGGRFEDVAAALDLDAL